jgi:putative transposase
MIMGPTFGSRGPKLSGYSFFRHQVSALSHPSTRLSMLRGPRGETTGRLRARQARRRLDFTHKLTSDLAKSHGWVGIEDLRVRNMTRSAKGTILVPGRGVTAKAGLNRGIINNAPYERRRQLAYKTQRYGSQLRLVRPALTSQTCSACGHRDPESRPGCGRLFACIACGYQAHADHNAARNIERIAAGQAIDSTRSHPRVARPAPSRMREPLVDQVA